MSIETTKPISESLQQLIHKANSSFEEGKHCVVLAYEQAIKEGFTPQEAKKLLFDKITAFSDRTIYRYLPAEAKDQNAVELASSKINLPSLTTVNDSVESKQLEYNKTKVDNDDIDNINSPFYYDQRHTLSKKYRHENTPIDDHGNGPRWLLGFHMNGYLVGMQEKNDSSLFCWLCEFDERYYKQNEIITHHHQIVEPIYSDKEMRFHVWFDHDVYVEGWSRYEPYLVKSSVRNKR